MEDVSEDGVLTFDKFYPPKEEQEATEKRWLEAMLSIGVKPVGEDATSAQWVLTLKPTGLEDGQRYAMIDIVEAIGKVSEKLGLKLREESDG